MARYSVPAFTRFVEQITINPITQCWEWQGKRSKDHYGEFSVSYLGRQTSKAHRFSFLIFNGYLPTRGRDVDHKCRVRYCVNPDHLQDVTHAENGWLRSAAQTACREGHPFDEANTYVTPKGHRVCKKCRYAKLVLWRKRHPEKARLVYRGFKAHEYNQIVSSERN